MGQCRFPPGVETSIVVICIPCSHLSSLPSCLFPFYFPRRHRLLYRDCLIRLRSRSICNTWKAKVEVLLNCVRGENHCSLQCGWCNLLPLQNCVSVKAGIPQILCQNNFLFLSSPLSLVDLAIINFISALPFCPKYYLSLPLTLLPHSLFKREESHVIT